MIILDGKSLSESIIKNLEIKAKEKKIVLASILVGSDEASKIYIDMKKKKCEQIGISVEKIEFEENIDEKTIISKIKELNSDKKITGILLQLPLPVKFNSRKIIEFISPKKDVDGLTSFNIGKITAGASGIIPCTPKGVMRLLNHYNIQLMGKDVCIIGASDDVGKPLGMLCLRQEATVSFTHIKTKDLKKYTNYSDIIMSATGVPGLLKKEMIKKGAVVIDIGISKVNGKIAGDVDESVKEVAYAISPVPGGVGPMTIAMLIENLIEIAYCDNSEEKSNES